MKHSPNVVMAVSPTTASCSCYTCLPFRHSDHAPTHGSRQLRTTKRRKIQDQTSKSAGAGWLNNRPPNENKNTTKSQLSSQKSKTLLPHNHSLLSLVTITHRHHILLKVDLTLTHRSCPEQRQTHDRCRPPNPNNRSTKNKTVPKRK